MIFSKIKLLALPLVLGIGLTVATPETAQARNGGIGFALPLILGVAGMAATQQAYAYQQQQAAYAAQMQAQQAARSCQPGYYYASDGRCYPTPQTQQYQAQQSAMAAEQANDATEARGVRRQQRAQVQRENDAVAEQNRVSALLHPAAPYTPHGAQ